jgi:hypothetical protein
MFIVTQFDPGINTYQDVISESMYFLGITFALVLVAFIGSLRYGVSSWAKLSYIDYIVIGTVCIVFGFLGISFLLFEISFDGGSCIRLLTFLMLWFWSSRWLPTDIISEKRILAGIPIVFSLVCLVGFFRIAMTMYHYHGGEVAKESGDYKSAIEHFDTAAISGHLLNLKTLHDDAVFAKAETLYRVGDTTEAAATLSLTEEFVSYISAGTWEGASGGMLYTNISCWKDLILYEGNVSIKIFARGDVALGIWPRMRVMLGDRVLGEVEVNSPEVRPYTFDVSVERARQRLNVAFTNDYFDPPENRNLWIEHAEIRYAEIAWK